MIRITPFKLALAALAVVTLVGCECGSSQPRAPKGSLAVLYPDPANPETTLSSEGTENQAEYQFDAVFMGQTSEMQIKIENTGSGVLELSSMEVLDGTDFVSIGDAVKAPRPVFQIDYAPNTTSVEPAGQHQIKVTFVPEQLEVTQQDYTVRLKLIATNTVDGHGEVIITINGRGVNGVCQIDSPVDFGAVARGDVAKQGITSSGQPGIRNPTQLEATAFIGDIFGSDSAAFLYTSDSARGSVTVPADSHKEVTIAFSPTDSREYLAFAKMRASAQCPEVVVQIQGSGVDAVLSVYWEKPDGTKANQVDFGYASPGVQVDRLVTFENLSKTDVAVSSLRWNQSDFKVLGEAGVADPTKLTVPKSSGGVAGKVKLPVAVNPSILGPRTSTLSFNTTLAKQPTGAITGKAFGGGPDIDVKPASTLAFGKVPYFQNANPPTFTKRKIVISNVGTIPPGGDVNGNLHLQTPTVAPMGTTTDASEVTLQLVTYNATTGLEAKVGQNSAVLEVTVTPNAVGQKQWELSIPSNDPDEPVVKIVVSADIQILPPCQNLTVTPGNLNFGLVSPPNYKDLQVAVKNNGSVLCLINNLDIKPGSDPAFSLPAGPVDSAELNAGDTMNIVVRVAPTGQVSSTLQTINGNLEFYVSRDTNPQVLVPLSATVAQGCLTIAPSDLDFGTVQRGCSSSTRTFSIYNSCGTTVTVNSITMINGGGFPANTPGSCPGTSACPEFFQTNSLPSGGTALSQGSSPITFSAKYVPLDLGADQGTIAVNATQNGQNVTYMVTLLGRGDTVGQNTDVFSQDAKPKADILLCIDSSGSMSSYQNSLSTNFQSFIQYAQAAGVDYHIAVITTDDYSAQHQGRFVSGVGHPEKVLFPTLADVENKFSAKVKVGTSGSATETCLSPLLKAVTAPLVTSDNAGFLRPDAKLAMVAVTDARDQSTQPATYYLSAFLNVKGIKAANAFTFNAIAGFNPNPPSGCYYDSGADDGKYAYLVQNTNGVKDEICTPNWSTTLQQLGKTAFGFRTNFFLNATPDLTGGKQIEVKIDGVVIPSTDSRGATVWAYDSVSNSVNFEPSYVPEPGQTMTIQYYVTCHAP